MPHVFETATTARSKCRGCGEKIAAGELRFGEALPNPFAEGETTHWFHPVCAAFKRPEPLLEALAAHAEALAERAEALPDRERLERDARAGVLHPRLQRISGAERAPTGRAACRHCKAPIEKAAWRIALVFYEDARFSPAGFVHVGCAPAYFETGASGPDAAGGSAVVERVRRFAPGLGAEDLREIERELAAAAGA
jgi:hypothetical protein